MPAKVTAGFRDGVSQPTRKLKLNPKEKVTLQARLGEEKPEFRRLAEKHREYDLKISEFDRIHYLTSEQERKRKELQKLMLTIKDQMNVIMRQYRILRQEKTAVTEDLGPLAGAFPELAALSDKDLTAAKRIWTHRLVKHVRMLPCKGSRR